MPSTPDTAPWTGPIARGCEVAFGRFYDAWFDRVFAMVRAISRRDEAFCLDAVQDTMMRVIKSMPPLETETRVEAWMKRCALTATIDRIRADRRRTHHESEAARDEHVAESALDDLADGERLDWLQDEIDELPPDDRALLLARFADGGTYAEAGAAVGMSGNAAYGRLRRIVARIRSKAKRWI